MSCIRAYNALQFTFSWISESSSISKTKQSTLREKRNILLPLKAYSGSSFSCSLYLKIKEVLHRTKTITFSESLSLHGVLARGPPPPVVDIELSKKKSILSRKK